MKLSYSLCGSMALRALVISLWTHTTSSWSRLDRSKYSCRISFLGGKKNPRICSLRGFWNAEKPLLSFASIMGDNTEWTQSANDSLTKKNRSLKGLSWEMWNIHPFKCFVYFFVFQQLGLSKNESCQYKCELWNLEYLLGNSVQLIWLSFTATVNSP